MAETDPSIFAAMTPVTECKVPDTAALDSLLVEMNEPFVIRGLVNEWPLVQAGLRSAREARRHLLEHARPVSFEVSLGPPGHDGWMFYKPDMTMNFRQGSGKLPNIFAGFDKYESEDRPATAYLASIDMRSHFDGLIDANPHPLGARKPLESIWIGTATRIAAHNDFPHNLACCAVGRRRFTLFPPDQFRNLYLGPIDNTPAGRAVSMVDFHTPDFDAHPRFSDALKHAQLAELEPGDALFIPSMWWHHVEGLSPFNVLVNYWWRETPHYLGQPQEALNHAILSIRDLPDEDKVIWRELFDHYVFENGAQVREHIPEGARGILDPLTPENAGRIRSFLLRTLNR